jgi:hypothetical protein
MRIFILRPRLYDILSLVLVATIGTYNATDAAPDSPADQCADLQPDSRPDPTSNPGTNTAAVLVLETR